MWGYTGYSTDYDRVALQVHTCAFILEEHRTHHLCVEVDVSLHVAGEYLDAT